MNMKNQKKRLVNWQDSMELTAGVFTQTEDYFIDAVRECSARGLTSYNYGLLPNGDKPCSADDIQISQHVTDRIEIRVLRCNAVTQTGIRVSFNPSDESGALVTTFSPGSGGKGEAGNWDVYISVDPYKRVPVGDLDPNEEPPRHPDAEVEYVVHVLPEGELKASILGGHYINIGRIRHDGDRYRVAGDYIPPCVSMKAHADLMHYYNLFGTLMAGMEKDSRQIIAKVFARDNGSTLAANVSSICRDVTRYIARVYFSYRNKAAECPPVDTLECVAGLAHTVYVGLHFLRGPQREELLKYFHEWNDILPGTIEQRLSQMLEAHYAHERIRGSMLQAEEVMRLLSELWGKLARLEYIGQHKESIVVSQETAGTGREAKASWSVID
jgi:hypothetical protein